MGAWGVDPWENDNAWDWLTYIETPMIGTISAALSSVKHDRFHSGYHEAIAAAALLSEFSFAGRRTSRLNLSYEAQRHNVYEDAVRVLRAIRDDPTWSDEWKNPAAVQAMLRRLINTLDRQWRAIEKRLRTSPFVVVHKKHHGRRAPKKGVTNVHNPTPEAKAKKKSR